MTSVEGMTSDTSDTSEVSETNTTINYPTNGLKIRQVKEEDITIFKITDYVYKVKLFNMKSNIFEWEYENLDNPIELEKKKDEKKKDDKRSIKNIHSLHRRIATISYNLRKKAFTITRDLFQTNNKKAIVEVINERIDFVEGYSKFEEIPIDTLLKDTV